MIHVVFPTHTIPIENGEREIVYVSRTERKEIEELMNCDIDKLSNEKILSLKRFINA